MLQGEVIDRLIEGDFGISLTSVCRRVSALGEDGADERSCWSLRGDGGGLGLEDTLLGAMLSE